MHAHDFDRNAMKILVNKAVGAPSVSREGKERIYSRIAEFTGKKAHGKNPIVSLACNPLLGLAAAIPVFVLLVAAGALQLANAAGYKGPTVAMVSGTAYMEDGARTLLSAGDRIATHAKIRIPEAALCDLSIDDRAALRLFSDSLFAVAGYSQASPRLSLSLEYGNLYIDKRSTLEHGGTIDLRINDYTFVLEGTRVLFQGFEKLIRVSCFDGRVRVLFNDREATREIFSLQSGEKIEIHTGEEGRTYSIDDFLSGEALRFDRDFIGFPLYDPALIEEYASFLGTAEAARKEGDAAASVTIQPDAALMKKKSDEAVKGSGSPEPTTPVEKEKYTITNIGSIRDKSIVSNVINFITSVQDSSSAYVVTQAALYRLNSDKIEQAVGFSDTPIFKVKPILAAHTLVLASTRNIYLVDGRTLAIRNRISLPQSGSVEDNYYPGYSNGVLYIPVLNNGYYSLQPDDPKPSLTLFYKEPFPITPVHSDYGILIGSSYGNYIASIDNRRSLLWKTQLEGKSFSNIVYADGEAYVYVLRNGIPYIISFYSSGRTKSEWRIENEVASDFAVMGSTLFGYYVNGELFSLDTRTGALSKLARLFTTKLANKTLRILAPQIENDLLYSGTDSGELFVYDAKGKKIVERTRIKPEEAFYATPVKIGDALYLFANSGNVYRVVRTDEAIR